TRLGGNSHYFAVQAFRRFGLDPLRDVTFIQAGGEPEILAALVKGSIDAGSVTSPTDAVALAQGFRYVLYGPDMGIPYAAATIATRRSVITKRPEALAQFMRAMAEAAKALHTEREIADRVLRKHLGITDRKILDAISKP
ncbi:MAG: ABC transporter substrate-binding protein, partial [Deltaproteobacteria bacterium]|nr:ABC transporter substrate-binding protein [Deltaproteobacteria bacterium]